MEYTIAGKTLRYTYLTVPKAKDGRVVTRI